jgi:hypothetical protein
MIADRLGSPDDGQVGFKAADVLPAALVHVTQPPTNSFQRAFVRIRGAEQAQGFRRTLEHGHDLEIDPIRRVLDRVLFRAIGGQQGSDASLRQRAFEYCPFDSPSFPILARTFMVHALARSQHCAQVAVDPM